MGRDDGMRANGMHWHACIRLSSTREETDARDAPTVTIDIDRIERLERVSLSLSNDEFIHSFIHSFRCERTKGRTNEGTNERTKGRARERRALERDARDARDATIDAFVRNSARREVRTSVSNARRIERIESRMHFKPPTGDDRGELQWNARMNGRDRVTDEFFV